MRGLCVHTRFCVTGQTTNYKAVATERTSVRDRRVWVRSVYKTCYWRPAVILQTGRFSSRRFRARYAWTRGDGRGRQVFMCYKLVMERCHLPQCLPADCNCRQVPSNPSPACNQYTNKRFYKIINRRGRCRRHRCTHPYDKCTVNRGLPPHFRTTSSTSDGEDRKRCIV